MEAIQSKRAVPLWQALFFPLLAGGMSWGIRGQYGHETGAMLAGLLIGLVVVFLYSPRSDLDYTFRAVALFALGIGFGGSMTYGQTIGLTQNPQVIGNWDAFRWGMLGLAIKGGLWIGFGGIFLGMGLGGVRYRFWEMVAIALGLLGLFVLGISLFNEPYDPTQKKLPFLYFSANWQWEPKEDLKPRREVWGGYLTGLIVLSLYLGFLRKDRLAPRLAFWGFLGGFIGFPLGQTIQAYHAWNPQVFTHGFWTGIAPYLNWWNTMETTFGAVMGAILGLGIWIHQNQIKPNPVEKPGNQEKQSDFQTGLIPAWLEITLMAIHIGLLISFEFRSTPLVTWLYQYGIPLAFLPLLAVSGGKWASYFQILPVLCIPIAGKTFVEVVIKQELFSPAMGWTFLVILPLMALTVLAFGIAIRSIREKESQVESGWALLATTWIYFFLNFCFFQFPWPWEPWTNRTPHGLIYFACALGLTAMVWMRHRSNSIRS